jgi:hypothetical protein
LARVALDEAEIVDDHQVEALARAMSLAPLPPDLHREAADVERGGSVISSGHCVDLLARLAPAAAVRTRARAAAADLFERRAAPPYSNTRSVIARVVSSARASRG